MANENLAGSLLRQIQHTTNDTSKVELLNSLGDYYPLNRLAEKINYLYGSYSGYSKIAFVDSTTSL